MIFKTKEMITSCEGLNNKCSNIRRASVIDESYVYTGMENEYYYRYLAREQNARAKLAYIFSIETRINWMENERQFEEGAKGSYRAILPLSAFTSSYA